MPVSKNLFKALRSLNLVAPCIPFVILLSGCALSKPGHESSTNLGRDTRAPVNLISTQEEQLLSEATARAQALHAQLRELEARTVVIPRRIANRGDTRILASEKRLVTVVKPNGKSAALLAKRPIIEPPVVVTERLEPLTKFSLEFASGSSELDESKRLALTISLEGSHPKAQKIGGNTKDKFLIQLSTYERVGLDQLNRDRLKAITGVLEAAGIPQGAVKISIRRVANVLGGVSKGSASRLVQITKLDASKVRS